MGFFSSWILFHSIYGFYPRLFINSYMDWMFLCCLVLCPCSILCCLRKRPLHSTDHRLRKIPPQIESVFLYVVHRILNPLTSRWLVKKEVEELRENYFTFCSDWAFLCCSTLYPCSKLFRLKRMPLYSSDHWIGAALQFCPSLFIWSIETSSTAGHWLVSP